MSQRLPIPLPLMTIAIARNPTVMALCLDLHLALGYRFSDDYIERYRLDVSAGLFDGELGGRVIYN